MSDWPECKWYQGSARPWGQDMPLVRYCFVAGERRFLAEEKDCRVCRQPAEQKHLAALERIVNDMDHIGIGSVEKP